MGDFGIRVSKESVDARRATGTDVLLDSTNPFAKLDTSKAISFSNIDFTFNTNPTEPTGVGTNIYTTTLVYTKAHGYGYVPSFWALVRITTPASGSVFYQDYFQDFGVVRSDSAFAAAEFYVSADATNIYFYIHKFRDTTFGTTTSNITGLRLLVRLYVFAEHIAS